MQRLRPIIFVVFCLLGGCASNLNPAVARNQTATPSNYMFVPSRYEVTDKNSAKPKDTSDAQVATSSVVDRLPSYRLNANPKAYAIVIGIERYRQKLPAADFAVNDAKAMTAYLTKAMGYPEENVVTLLNENASKSDFEKYIERWLPNNLEDGGSVFVYYSGHGAPNPKTGNAFLVPYDGDPSFIEETGYSLERLYDKLGKLNARKVIVALDSCFSGAGGRSVLAKGARPLVMAKDTSVALAKQIVVMAAASGDQVSSSYEEKGHGVFTYFLLNGIKEHLEGSKGREGLAVETLYDYLKPQVERVSRKLNNNEQTPQLIVGDEKLKRLGLL